MKKFFGLKDEDGKQYVLTVNQNSSNGEKHFDIEKSDYQKVVDEADEKFRYNAQWFSKYYASCPSFEADPNSLKYNWLIHNFSSTMIYARYIGSNLLQGINGTLYGNDNYHDAASFEIKGHLTKLAKEKGYSKGKSVISAYCNQKYNLDSDNIEYDAREDALLMDSTAIYCQGKWAEIVPDKKKLPKTKDELLALLLKWDKDRDVKSFLEDYED
jgi:hypothetical protein